MRYIIYILLVCVLLTGCSQPPVVEKKELCEQAFVSFSLRDGIHAFWHWMDGAITRKGITRDLEAMKEQGVTQVAILNVSLFGSREMDVPRKTFASNEWFDLFRWALDEAERLDLRIGMHSADGWSGAAGPWITPEHSMKRLTWTKTIEQSNGTIDVLLPQPVKNHDFYRDVAVIAMRTGQKLSAFHRARPAIKRNGNENASALIDGSPVSYLTLQRGDTLDIVFDEEITFNKISVFPYHHSMWGDPENFEYHFSVFLSDDGINYQYHATAKTKGSNQLSIAVVPKGTTRHVRLLLTDSRNRQFVVPANIGELELLWEDEKPLFSPALPDLIQKGASVRSGQDQYFSRSTAKLSQNHVAYNEVIDITAYMDDNGHLYWDAPPGSWTILRTGYTTTGNINNPASPAGVGLECDKLDTTALGLHFRNFPAKLIDVAGDHTGNAFRFILLDSWESDYQNWTSLMPQHFEKKNGYSIIPWLAVMCGEIVGCKDESEAFLYDFRSTIALLLENNYYKYYRELCNKNGLEFHAEAIYGNYSYPPIDIINANRHLDMPMTEFWTHTDKDYNLRPNNRSEDIMHLSVSASRLYGMPVVGAEAYTGLAHFSESLFDLKPFGDKAFSAGINQMILHSYVHQPDERRPGFTLGRYGSHFNRHNTWWPYMKDWADYQSRLQYVLQKGSTVTDVLYYLGDQLPQFTYPNVSNRVPPGYTLSACNFEFLKNQVDIARGKIIINRTDTVSILSLPPYPFMHFETLLLLEDYVKRGMVLFGPRPGHLLTRQDHLHSREQFEEIVSLMWGDGDPRGPTARNYGMGMVLWGMSLEEALQKVNVRPDFSTALNDYSSFRFLHKKVGDTDVYFVANQTDASLCHDLMFRVADKTPQIWDPETGEVYYPAIFSIKDGMTRIPIKFSPYQAYLFVFSPQRPSRHIVRVLRNNELVFPHPHLPVKAPDILSAENGFVFKMGKSGTYQLTTNDHKTIEMEVSGPITEVISDYFGNIVFDPAYDAKVDFIPFKELKPLTSYSDPSIRYFSGNAHYTFKFALPEAFRYKEGRFLLDIGQYRSVADVTLNSVCLGYFWGNTSQFDVTGLLHPFNELKVTITNEYRNRIIGDLTQYGELRNLWTPANVTEFLEPGQPLRPSGWMGPVELGVFEKVLFTFD